MATGYNKEPAPPTGGDPIATWARQFQAWSKQFLVKTVKGARTKPDPNGGFHLIIPPTIVPPSTPATGNSNFIGEIDLTGGTNYTPGQWGFVSIGANMGEYVCIQATDALSNPPWVGNNFWMQSPNSSSQWM